jgi:myo-inositol-1(or 4)-monophosphatase
VNVALTARVSAFSKRSIRFAVPRALFSSKSPSPAITITATWIDLEAWNELSCTQLESILNAAERAARAAGGTITSNTGCCSLNVEKECEVKYNIKDIVTAYDKQAQTAIEDVIRTAFPTHSFLGEEDVASGAAASEAALLHALQDTETGFIWICDPIDGTANFASGLRMSAVTMGVVYRGTPIVGVVYDPHRDEMFSAIRGQGATLNGKAIQVAQSVQHAKDAIINAGCPADPNAFATSMRCVLALKSKCRGLRMIACSALTTAWIASGRLGAHFGYDLSSWDLVAGALLIQEAGGKVTDLDGTPYKLETRNMLCSNGLVHEPILDILKEADAISFTRSTYSD